ncbi:uncharacterized protein THITE_113865 [Thermothielavioides terrestris NRRL 8126]|uniref:Uncharacterized protein n=1 Tax=Thermothielavioides terrestris (strain ATCC 38088 / NRRL 8126) TaxID=578455 RepID=G2RBK2_THETT|nr:uncharacterized protein THITE_113865 [Thermothielavioides terrestris NRRL 8126]AEO69173.1 hypothetical protein THITE_113865 [Thermothielavioides terrestris NRRL 8126]
MLASNKAWVGDDKGPYARPIAAESNGVIILVFTLTVPGNAAEGPTTRRRLRKYHASPTREPAKDRSVKAAQKPSGSGTQCKEHVQYTIGKRHVEAGMPDPVRAQSAIRRLGSSTRPGVSANISSEVGLARGHAAGDKLRSISGPDVPPPRVGPSPP